MRFNGKTLESRNRREVAFFRGDEKISLVVGAVSRTVIADWRTKGIWKVVTPPEVAVKLPNGAWDRDDSGNLKYRANDRDPAYLEENYRNNQRLSAMKLWHGLRYDTNFQFDAKPPAGAATPQEWQEFADKLSAEINHPETGFEDGELELLYDGIEACDVVKELKEDEAVRNF